METFLQGIRDVVGLHYEFISANLQNRFAKTRKEIGCGVDEAFATVVKNLPKSITVLGKTCLNFFSVQISIICPV